MKIGELSRRTGVSIRMLRYYEDEGLLAPDRTASGYRDYTPDDADVVARIILLGRAGMTLSDIREFLPCALDARGVFEPCDALKTKLRDRIAGIDKQTHVLAESRALLADMLVRFEASTP